MTLKEIAQLLNVTLKGAPERTIEGVADIERLPADASIKDTFIYFIESPAVLKRHPRAIENGVILTIPTLADKFTTALIAPEQEVRLAFIKLLQTFDRAPSFPAGISPQAIVHPSAKVAPGAVILPGTVIMEGAEIGDKCVLYPGVVIEPFARVGDATVIFPNCVVGHHCSIGKSCIIHGGTVIGADGFGFFDRAGQRHKIPQIGNVEIGDFVEIGGSCTVDRATIETTRIGLQTKLDDQVHVGHNAQVGRFVYIVGNTALGGSCVVEDGAMISGNCIIADHITIAAGSMVMAMTGVAQDTKPKSAYFGIPARPAKLMHKMNAALERLPELLKKVRDLEAKVEALQAPQPEPVLTEV